MFVQLEHPQYYMTADGKKLWYVSTLLVSEGKLKYLDDRCELVGYPVRYDNLERIWNLASKYYTNNNEIYPYAYVEADDICIRMSDVIVNALHLAVKNLKVESTVMEFE